MDGMTDDQFAELTKDYVAPTEARLALIKADLPATPEAVATYRELAEREWALGQARDTELQRVAQG